MSKENTPDNNVTDLQTMMFEQMRRLSNPENDLDKEIKRSQALASAGTVIINAAKVHIDTARVGYLIGNKKDKGLSKGDASKQISNG